MKLASTARKHITRIYQTAASLSRDTRDRLDTLHLADLVRTAPHRQWLDLLAERAAAGHVEQLDQAAAELVRLASPGTRRAVARVVKNLLVAVRDLASYTPEYRRGRIVMPAAIAERFGGRGDWTFPAWRVTGESLARLDQLRQRVRVRLIETDELFRQHPDAMARLCAVAARVSEIVLPPARAGVVKEWFTRLGKDEAAA